MNTLKIVKLGFYIPPVLKPLLNSTEREYQYLSLKSNAYGRLLLTLKNFLERYEEKIDTVDYFITYEHDQSDTLKGLIGHINRSEVDVGVLPMHMYKESLEAVDFCYPYKLYYFTFVTPKPTYKPQIFGIFQTLSLSVWITIALGFLAVVLIYFFLLKWKYPFNKILFHVFAVLLRQSAIIIPSSFTEKTLIYSWVFAAMFLCLAYDSVFLSFLSLPPLIKIKHVSDLARAVDNGEYHCMSPPTLAVGERFIMSEQTHLKAIGKDLLKNKLSSGNVYLKFIRKSRKQNLAYFADTGTLDKFVGKYYISEDRFFETMAGMMVQRNFCCKNLLNTFVHKMMSSGILEKYHSDGAYLTSLPLSLAFPEKYESKRKLTLTDVAPAFIFLLSGHFIAFLFFIGEILINRRNAHLEILRI